MLRLFARSLLQYRVIVYGVVLTALAWDWSHDAGRFLARAQEKKKAVEEAGPSADAPPTVAANENAPPPAAANAAGQR